MDPASRHFAKYFSVGRRVAQVHLISTRQPEAAPICVARRQPGVQYFVEHHGSHLFIMTNTTLDEFVRSTRAAAAIPDARLSIAAGDLSTTAYEAAPGDRAEDISFSRWSSADWESAEGSPQTDSSPSQRRPPALYQEGAADRAEDISFSRWSPASWETDSTSAGGCGLSSGDTAEYRLLRMPIVDGVPSR